jgi:hypothetical protein
MSKKYIFLGAALVLALSLTWAGRAVYRAHFNLVTLDAYNAPLAFVIKQMERQTRETILAGKGLDAKVTLKVKNMPLDEALDKLGQQTGAMWSKWHAVHGSGRALNQLEAALSERSKIEDAGWTNIAPQEPAGGPSWEGADVPAGAGTVTREITSAGGGVSVSGRKPVMIKLNPDDVKGGDVQAAIREKLRAAGVDEATIAKAGAAMKEQTMDVDVQAGPGGGAAAVDDTVSNGNVIIKKGGPGGDASPRIRMVTRSRDANGQVTTEVWSPEHVVLEQKLRPKLGDRNYQEASEKVAQEVCDKVKGDLTTLYVLRGSPGGFPMAGRMMRKIHSGTPMGTNGGPGEVPPMPDIESVVKRHEAENYTKLTPEQRVQRAREKQTAKTK